MFGITKLLVSREIKKRENEVGNIEKLLAFEKLKLRARAVEDLKKRHSDIEIVVNSQSETIFGFSPAAKSFYSGQVFDSVFPDISALPNSIRTSVFYDKIAEVREKILNPKESWDPEYRDYQANGYSFLIDSCHPTDATITKNGKVIGRSNFYYPKDIGYFNRVIRNNIIEDIRGGDDLGISTIELRMESTWHSGTFFAKLHYSYADTPRKSSNQNIDHLNKVASLFIPFLSVIEAELIDPHEFLHDSDSPTKYDLDDTLLDLPPNKHRNPSKIFG